jgi:carboxybiotin decarboxylase
MRYIYKVLTILIFMVCVGKLDAQQVPASDSASVKVETSLVSPTVAAVTSCPAVSTSFFNESFFSVATGFKAIMMVIGLLFILLSIKYNYQPLLLVPIGIGMLISNIPFFINGSVPFNILQENSFMNIFYKGLSYGIYPSLIFIGIGAMTDFSALIANPKLMLLGAASQVGLFVALILGAHYGFQLPTAAALGFIGGADGPIAIFTSSQLSAGYLVPIALCTYAYMALVPVIQPPLMRFLTSKNERLIRMKPQRAVSYNEKILFPIIGLILTGILIPRALLILGMLFFGNLLKESGGTRRLALTASNTLLDIVTILLGLTLGAAAQPEIILKHEALLIFILGGIAFVVATTSGVLFAKFMNLFLSKENKINPLIGNAGVSAMPDSARVSHKEGLRADPTNHLLVHAMGPNIAGIIASAIAAGVLMSFLM